MRQVGYMNNPCASCCGGDRADRDRILSVNDLLAYEKAYRDIVTPGWIAANSMENYQTRLIGYYSHGVDNRVEVHFPPLGIIVDQFEADYGFIMAIKAYIVSMIYFSNSFGNSCDVVFPGAGEVNGGDAFPIVGLNDAVREKNCVKLLKVLLSPEFGDVLMSLDDLTYGLTTFVASMGWSPTYFTALYLTYHVNDTFKLSQEYLDGEWEDRSPIEDVLYSLIEDYVTSTMTVDEFKELAKETLFAPVI